MEPIKKYDYFWISDNLLNKTIHLTSTCEMFPNFDIKGKVYKIDIRQNTEILIYVDTIPSHKKMTVGSNMKDLKFEILN